ncbi:MAG: phosphoribosylformylglycinamidine synthase subunit PurQ [Desulfurococcaceae archaeon]|nr:phosphoribosylformylglycinamidine synthase subunit PurQ [Desulfurococcaceae archaeon]
MIKVAVLKFPGTNCDEDVHHVLKNVFFVDSQIVWYKNFSLNGWDAIIIPGGFSYGDWLRAGAIAARTSAIEELINARDIGVPVLGICNGFQILVEAGLLPGALLPNESGRFVCRWVRTYVERPRGPWLSLTTEGYEIHMPVAHGEGRYYIDEENYQNILLKSPLIRYAKGDNPNGSVYDIAGVASEDGLILGLMPHPERSSEDLLPPRGFRPGGRIIFESLVYSLKRGW